MMDKEKRLQTHQQLVAQRRADNLCVKCAQPLPSEHHAEQCPECLDKLRDSLRRLKQRRQTARQCITCGAALPKSYKYQTCESCRSHDAKQQRRRIANRRRSGQCVGCGDILDTQTIRCSVCQPKHLKASQQRTHRIRQEAINAYGGKCACCGEANIWFLTIDHIRGDGAKHRRALSSQGGANLYFKLKARGFPNDPPLQVLCWNCNLAKHHLGLCPHQV